VPLARDGGVSIDSHEGSMTVTTRDRVRYGAETVPADEGPDGEKVTSRTRTSDDRLRLATDHEDGHRTFNGGGPLLTLDIVSGTAALRSLRAREAVGRRQKSSS
jgi:hypothetical protein